ncbi:CPBP family intramembrane metalloprotease [Humibacter sp. BT305]|nr:CPBP family intramembrane metalloprotease [Humibacter sp. BT305]
MSTTNAAIPASSPARPGWPELAVGVAVTVLLYLVGGTLLALVPSDAVFSPGLAAFLLSGGAPIVGVLVAVLIRMRDLRPFGFRRVHPGWVLVGVAAGIGAFLLSWPVSWVFDPFFPGSEAVQQGYRDASQAGVLSLLATVALGGVLTPIGEEMLFRGLITNFLLRWNGWLAILLGAAIFAVAHGVNAVMPLALVVGLATGALFARTGSIWPGIAVHVTYNTLGLLYHGLAA